MEKLAAMILENEVFFIKGKLEFSNVMDLYALNKDQLENIARLVFDFSEVKSSDSSGLALIVEWIRYAKEKNKTIVLRNLSKKLLLLAAVAGLEPIILPLCEPSQKI